MSNKARHIYEFGSFRIDTEDRLLIREGQLIPLPPKAIDTLLALIAGGGRVMEKDELIKMVWPGTFVEEGGLARNISQLRKALGDGSENGQYIETIPKRGYRWVGPVDQVAEEQSPAEDLAPKSLRPPVRLGYRTVIAATALVAALLTSWSYFRVPAETLHSIVVLPLRDLSPEPQEYLATGMTEALLTNLAKIGALKVVSYGALQPNGSETPAADIASTANVGAALQGSVLRAGERVRITVRLVRARTGEQLWAEEYEEDVRDILRLQSSVAQKIAQAIKVKVTPQERTRLTASHPVRPEAYLDYLRGRYYWNKRTLEGFQKALDHFERCIQEDPGYASAYSGLADVYSLLGSSSYDALPPRVAMPKAKEAALMAVKLDDGLAEAHASLAYVLLAYDWDWPGAEKEFRRALELNPGYATAHHWYALYLLAQGRTDQALVEMKTALDREPLSLAINTGVGWCLYLARQYDQAAAQYRKTLEMDRNFVLAEIMLGMALERQGAYPDAIQAFKRALVTAPQSTFALARLGQTYAASGDRREARRILESLDQISKTRYVPAIYPGAIYVGLDDMDRAYDWAERAYAARSHYVIYFNVEPSLDRFRLDPRFSGFSRRLGLQ